MTKKKISAYITEDDIENIMSVIPKRLTPIDIQGLVVTLVLSYIEDLDHARYILKVVMDNLEVVAQSRSKYDSTERTLH